MRLLFFGTNRENLLIKNIYLNRRDIFESFCNYFLYKGNKIITAATDSKVILPYKSNFVIQPRNFHINEFLKEISTYKSDWTKLSRRELDCAFFLVQGMSNKEIAQNLSVSTRTIEDYINNIRYKMNCKSKAKLISLLCKLPFEAIQNC